MGASCEGQEEGCGQIGVSGGRELKVGCPFPATVQTKQMRDPPCPLGAGWVVPSPLHPPSTHPTAALLTEEFWGVGEGKGVSRGLCSGPNTPTQAVCQDPARWAGQDAGKEAAARSHRNDQEQRGPAQVPAQAGFPGVWSSPQQGCPRLVGWPSA